MASFEHYMTVRLFPTPTQVESLMDARNKLMAARTAVSHAQAEHYSATGTYLQLKDVWSTNPDVHIDEVFAISSGVIELSIVRAWIQAGLSEGRGRSVNEDRLNFFHYPPLVRSNDGTCSLGVANIGRILMADTLNGVVDSKDLKARLLFPSGGADDWEADIYRKPLSEPEPSEPVAEPSADVEHLFVKRTLVDAAETLLARDNLSGDQKTALELVLEEFPVGDLRPLD